MAKKVAVVAKRRTLVDVAASKRECEIFRAVVMLEEGIPMRDALGRHIREKIKSAGHSGVVSSK